MERQQNNSAAGIISPGIPSPSTGENRVYVGSLHYDIKESDIRMLFSSFGAIRCIDMSYEPTTGKSKGFCFVEYETSAAADAAQAMNNFELAGRNIRVGRPHLSTTAQQAAIPVGSAYIPTIAPGMTTKQQAYVLLAQAFTLSGVQPPPAVINFLQPNPSHLHSSV